MNTIVYDIYDKAISNMVHFGKVPYSSTIVRNGMVIIMSSESGDGFPLARLQPTGITYIANSEFFDTKAIGAVNSNIAILQKKGDKLYVRTALGNEIYRPGLFVSAKNGMTTDQTLWSTIEERKNAIRLIGEEYIQEFIKNNTPVPTKRKSKKNLPIDPTVLKVMSDEMVRNVDKALKDIHDVDETDEIRTLRIPSELLGKYTHYKGNEYIVSALPVYKTGRAYNEKTMVVYSPVDDLNKTYVREWNDFFSTVLHPTGTGVLPRFEKSWN